MIKAGIIHYCYEWLPPTENWIYNQVCFLPASLEPHVVCEKTSHGDLFPVAHLHCFEQLPRWRQAADKFIRKAGLRHHLRLLVQVAEDHHCQLLHSHFGSTGWNNLGAARAAHLKHVVTFYGIDVNHLPRVNPRWQQRYREMFNHADGFLCEGPHMGKCLEKLGCPPSKIQIHHLGVNLSQLKFVSRRWESGPLRILVAATFKEKKGICYALDALGIVKKQIPVAVTLVGEATAEARSLLEKEKIKEAIRRNGLEDSLQWRGALAYSKLIEEAYGHHIFLSPSVTAEDGDTEGGAPVTLIDLSATGMPIISTWHCDIPEVVLNDKTGYLVPERNAQALSEALIRLADQRQNWECMGKNGRMHIEKNFDAAQQGARLGSYYFQILSK
jgi:colanic acid/amylovoran biosynthesis glycosyltransferase